MWGFITFSREETHKKGFGGLSGSSRVQTSRTVLTDGSEVIANTQNLDLIAADDITIVGSTVSAGEDATLDAGGDVNLISAIDSQSDYLEEKKKSFGISFTGKGIDFAEATTDGKMTTTETNVASVVSGGNNVTIAATDINVAGSQVISTDTVNLNATNNVNMIATGTQTDTGDWHEKQTIGFSFDSDENSISFFAGETEIKDRTTESQTQINSSLIASGNNVNITAGDTINQIGSNVSATNDITLTADNINSLAATGANSVTQFHSESRNGLGVSMNHDFGKTKDAVSGAGEGDNGVSRASSVLKTLDAISSFTQGPSINASFGNTKTETEYTQTLQAAQGSNLAAGNDITLNANEDITLESTRVNAGNDINATAENINITAAAQTLNSEQSTETSSSGFVLNAGKGSFSIGVQVSGSDSDLTTDGSQGIGAQLGAGNSVNLNANNDILIEGATINANNDVSLDAGNNVTIKQAVNSQHSDLDESSFSVGAGLAVTVGEGGASAGVYVEGSVGMNEL